MVMIMKLQHRILIIICLLTVVFSSLSFANTTIKITESQLDTDIELLSANSECYRLDFKDGLFMNPFKELAGALFFLYRFFVRIIIIIIMNAFTLNIYTIFSTQILSILEPLKIVVFDNWITVVLGFLLIYLLVQSNQGRTTFVITEFIKYMCLLMFFLYFLAYPIKVVTAGKDVSNAVANEIILTTYSENEGTSIDDGVAVLLNQIWEAQVARPWRTLNFNDKADEYEKQFLEAKPNSSERERLTKQLRAESPVYGTELLPLVLILMISSTIELSVYLILGAIGLGSGGLLFALIIMSVFVFLMAMLPRYGIQVALNWLEKGIFILMINVIAMTALIFVLFISQMVYDSVVPTTPEDLFILLVLKAAFIYILYRFRRFFVSIFVVTKRGVKGVNRKLNRYSDPRRQLRMDNQEASVRKEKRNRLIEKGREFASGRDQDNYNTSKHKANQKKTRSEGQKAAEEHQSKQTDHTANKSQTKQSEQAPSKKQARHSSLNQEKHYSSPPKQRNFSAKEDLANEVLTKRFEYEKRDAEKQSKEQSYEKGKTVEPRYSNFVKKTMKNEERGTEKFTRRQRMNVIKEMNEYEKRGMDARVIFDKYQNVGDNEYVPANQVEENEPELKDRSAKMEEQIYREEMKSHMDFNHNITAESTNREIAEIYLHNQFMNHKLDAHVNARVKSANTGKAEAPVYDAFAQKVNDRIKNHHKRFSNAEISATEKKIEKLQSEGVDMNNYMKKMSSHDMSDIMGAKSEERSYNVKNDMNRSSQATTEPRTKISSDQRTKTSTKDTEELMAEVNRTIEKKMPSAQTISAEKIDYDKIRSILENDIREAKDVEEIRDNIEKIQKEMNQPLDLKRADQLAKQVVETNDFRNISDYIDSIREQTDEDKD